MSEKNEVYFAAREGEEKAAALIEKTATFYQRMEKNSYLDKIERMYHYYYGNFNFEQGEGHEITFTGEQGELVSLPVNHFRNLARNIFNMIIANRPVLESRAINSDYKSLSQTYLANGILDYYMREKDLEDVVNEAVEMALVLGSSFIKMSWNSMKGEVYEVDDNGEPLLNGEMEFDILSQLDVVTDGTKERWGNPEWIITRTYVNRYNLIAQYPQFHKEIMALETKNTPANTRLGHFSNDNTDDVPVYEFFHAKTPAMPEGNYFMYLSEEVVLLDVPLPYRNIPIFRLAPANIMGTPYGYSDLFDVFPIQEALNSIYSGIMSNQNSFLVQSLFVQKGSDLSIESIEGMTIMEGNTPPEAVQLTQSPKEAFEFLAKLIQDAETLAGVNSVTRGNPEASLRSGTALALVQAMSIQFQSGFQKAYVKFLENIGTNLIEILKEYATAPKMIAIVGKNKAPLLKQFTGDMIKDVQRVTVEVGNPLARTIAGRVQMAEQMAQMKLIKNSQQYFMVIETGQLDTMMEGDISDLLNIKRENELLLEGEAVMADILDQHRMHIMEHRVVINDPDLRSNPELYAAVKAHIQEHINMLRTVDPDLLQLIGEQPLMNPSAPQMPQEGQAPPQAPGQPGGPMGNKEVIEEGALNEMLDPGQLGAQAPADQVVDNQPSVDAELLPNPSLDPRAK